MSPEGKTATATFAAGCFWCTEAVFVRLKGVSKVQSGYTGGQVPNPTYRQVCTGATGMLKAFRSPTIRQLSPTNSYWTFSSTHTTRRR